MFISVQLSCTGWRESCGSVAQYLAVPDAKRFDPSLLPKRQRDEESQFYQFRHRKVLVEFRPKCVVCNLVIPDDGARIRQRHLLALGEFG